MNPDLPALSPAPAWHVPWRLLGHRGEESLRARPVWWLRSERFSNESPSMLATSFAIAAVIAWSAGAAVSVADLFGEGARTERVARAASAFGTVLTLASLSAIVSAQGVSAAVGPANRFLFLAAVVGVGALALRRRINMRAATALVSVFGVVGTAAFLLAPTRLADTPMVPLLTVHVGLVLVGIGTFALSAVASTLYLVQERQLRKRNFGSLFQKLPSLEELDTASFRLVAWGFVVYTAALILGFVWMAQSGSDATTVRNGLALAAWAIFAGVIHTRITTGWRGRRSAIMIVAGCVATYAVLMGYIAR